MCLFLQRQTGSQMAHSRLMHFSWTNEDLSCLNPEGRSSEVKGCLSAVAESKASLTYLFASVDLYSFEDI